MAEALVGELNRETTAILFTMMAEDVYLSLLGSLDRDEAIRRQVAMALIILWEHRTDLIAADVSPVLQAVWEAQQHLVPVFGSMMGMSELLFISMDLDITWNHFIRTRLADPDVTMALEEFLMSLSYEQIVKLRGMLRERGIKAINRDEVADFLGEKLNTSHDVGGSDFYGLSTVRRDNAQARKRLGLPGPHNTLEDHYMVFVMEHMDPLRFNTAFGVTLETPQ
jgi:hypothetical protein